MAQRTCEFDGCDNTHRARGLCSTHYNLLIMRPGTRHRRVTVPCTVCGTVVSRKPSDSRPTCSPECRQLLTHGVAAKGRSDRDDDMVYRARRYGARIVDRVNATDVFEAAGWRCYLCGTPVSTDVDCYQPTSATVDHVTPLALGGDHSYANCRCACFSCNSSKQARVLVTQGSRI